LCGILFVLRTGAEGEYLPRELGFGSGVTCGSPLAAWNGADVWPLAVIDSSLGGRPEAAPKRASLVDGAGMGGRHHVITDAQGIPLAGQLTGGNRDGVTRLLSLQGFAGGRVAGRSWCRPGALLAERDQPRPSALGIFRYVVERNDRLTARLPPRAHPLGPTRRPPRSLPRPCHLSPR
jgi:hypothetical protein